LQVDFSQGPGASSYTVQFNLLNNAPGVQAVALITWTVAGNFVTRRVTVGNGVSVTGTGQAVQVRVIDNSLVASAGSKYNVSILVAPGVRGSSAEPPTLVVSDPIVGYAIPVAPGASHDFPVPLDAGVTQVYITVQGALDAGGVTLGTSEAQERGGGLPFKSWDPGQTFFWVPVAPGTDTIRVTTGATAVSTYAFTCTLGIDG